MEESDARNFYQEYSSETWFEDACTSMAERGETTAISMSRVKGVASLQALAGPADPKDVRNLRVVCVTVYLLFFLWYIV